MGFVATGVPGHVEAKTVETQDGTFERVRFTLAHPLSVDDTYPDLFQVGSKYADEVREAAANGTPISVFVPFRKEKEAAKNGSDRDVYYWRVHSLNV